MVSDMKANVVFGDLNPCGGKNLVSIMRHINRINVVNILEELGSL
jgi:hypothetical protein